MTREEFIREIRENLAGKLPSNAIEEVVYDYNEHFEAGLADGRTEAQVSSELGSPAKLCRDILQGEHPSVERPETGHTVEAAPLGSRVIAYAIDSFVAAIPIALISGVSNALILAPLSPLHLMGITAYARHTAPAILLPGIVGLLFYVLYQPVTLIMLKGQTPGKKLMQLRVVRRNGSPLTIGTVLGREVLGKMIINTVTFGLAPVISFIWALLSPERRTVHDEIGATRVIPVRR